MNALCFFQTLTNKLLFSCGNISVNCKVWDWISSDLRIWHWAVKYLYLLDTDPTKSFVSHLNYTIGWIPREHFYCSHFAWKNTKSFAELLLLLPEDKVKGIQEMHNIFTGLHDAVHFLPPTLFLFTFFSTPCLQDLTLSLAVFSSSEKLENNYWLHMPPKMSAYFFCCH